MNNLSSYYGLTDSRIESFRHRFTCIRLWLLFLKKKLTFVLNFSDTFSANSGLDDPFGMTSFSSAPAIAKPAVNSNPLASLDDLDPFKNL